MGDGTTAETQRVLATWTDEQYAMVSAKMVDKAIAGKAMTLGYQLDLGKWMLASLLVVNGGALVAIANADEMAAKLFQAGGQWFVAGMVAALVSGFFAWANAAVAADVYDDIANPWALVSRENWPTVPQRSSKAIAATTVLSVASGIASVVLFTVGALASGGALSATPKGKWKAPSAAYRATSPQAAPTR
jgi:hypothetical protein